MDWVVIYMCLFKLFFVHLGGFSYLFVFFCQGSAAPRQPWLSLTFKPIWILLKKKIKRGIVIFGSSLDFHLNIKMFISLRITFDSRAHLFAVRIRKLFYTLCEVCTFVDERTVIFIFILRSHKFSLKLIFLFYFFQPKILTVDF